MAETFIGSVISIECKGKLGTYQGQVSKVNKSGQTLSITKAFHNGKMCDVSEVTISATDIRDIQIIKSPELASELPKIRHKNKSTTPISHAVNIRPAKNDGQCDSRSYGTSPIKDLQSNNYHTNIKRSQSFKDSNARSRSARRSTPTNEDGFRKRTSSASASDHRRDKSATPKKMQQVPHQSRQQSRRDECLSAPLDASYLDEFDFEKNLALFDKRAVFDEIERGSNPELTQATESTQTKYRYDENVLESTPAEFQRIKVPDTTKGEHLYVTDSGLVVPSISLQLRQQLCNTAVQYKLSVERQLEVIGRSASEMVLQLVGGSNRLSPQNEHQRPSVIVLCGPQMQGAIGVNCARQLANRNVDVSIYVPTGQTVAQELSDEIQLFELTNGKRKTTTKDLPQKPVDMIINCLNSHTDNPGSAQPWYPTVVQWANQNKAHVLTIDPPATGLHINTKWSLSLILPLSLSDACGQVYLCDLGFPRTIFKDCGITYSSPFGHKFVIPLHKR